MAGLPPVFHAHSWTLVNDYYAIGVTKFHDLLRVWIVAGAEGIGPQPAQKVEVFHDQGPVQTFATDLLQGKKQTW